MKEKERLLKLLKYSQEAIDYWFDGCGDSPEECINENDHFKEEAKYFIEKIEKDEIDFNIICPYCNHKHEGLDYVETGDMEGDSTMNCEECGEEFNVKFNTIINFEIEKIE
jgi:DNA-directed RNA polymerase subunit RPC12/RpoP